MGHRDELARRPLGSTRLEVTPLGFGAVKIGRNRNVKYPEAYELPTEEEAARILNGVLDLGITYIDTAPAYELSEERIGRAVAHRRKEFVLSTKVGEHAANGRFWHDFSVDAIRTSVEASLRRLRTDAVDVLFIHSHGDDLAILHESDAVEVLCALRQKGLTRAIGLSGKTAAGFEETLTWADVIMIEYSPAHVDLEPVIESAAEAGVGVVVKKGLGSGRLSPELAIEFVLGNRRVDSLVIGGKDLDHIKANLEVARRVRKGLHGSQ